MPWENGELREGGGGRGRRVEGEEEEEEEGRVSYF